MRGIDDFCARRLQITLEPESCWGFDLEAALGHAGRRALDAAASDLGRHCDICGVRATRREPLWRYDETRGLRRLVGFGLRCDLCWLCHHFGLAGIKAQQGEADLEEVISQYCRVNQCTREQFHSDLLGAYEEWTRRSTINWISDLGHFMGVRPRGGECSE